MSEQERKRNLYSPPPPPEIPADVPRSAGAPRTIAWKTYLQQMMKARGIEVDRETAWLIFRDIFDGLCEFLIYDPDHKLPLNGIGTFEIQQAVPRGQKAEVYNLDPRLKWKPSTRYIDVLEERFPGVFKEGKTKDDLPKSEPRGVAKTRQEARQEAEAQEADAVAAQAAAEAPPAAVVATQTEAAPEAAPDPFGSSLDNPFALPLQEEESSGEPEPVTEETGFDEATPAFDLGAAFNGQPQTEGIPEDPDEGPNTEDADPFAAL